RRAGPSGTHADPVVRTAGPRARRAHTRGQDRRIAADRSVAVAGRSAKGVQVKVAGIMSGTSLDGIDVAASEMPVVRTLAFRTTPYPAAIREALLGPLDAQTISRLNYEIAELYAKAVKRMGPVDLIGCHGQTIYHEGARHTLQLGEPAIIAERTGVPV